MMEKRLMERSLKLEGNSEILVTYLLSTLYAVYIYYNASCNN